jgi:hypothetical protein
MGSILSSAKLKRAASCKPIQVVMRLPKQSADRRESREGQGACAVLNYMLLVWRPPGEIEGA